MVGVGSPPGILGNTIKHLIAILLVLVLTWTFAARDALLLFTFFIPSVRYLVTKRSARITHIYSTHYYSKYRLKRCLYVK